MSSFFRLFVIRVLHGSLDSGLDMAPFTLSALATAVWFGRLYVPVSAKMMLMVPSIGVGVIFIRSRTPSPFCS